jgi:hypothetical protein
MPSLGLARSSLVAPRKPEAHIGQALRLSPRDMSAYAWLTEVGVAKNHLGDCEQAVLWRRRAIANARKPDDRQGASKRARLASNAMAEASRDAAAL